jgi:sec-independent protein translocase protein TatA
MIDCTLAFMIGPMEIGMIALVGLLIFGNRLPEVGKSLGRGIVEFKKGIKGITDDIDESASKPNLPPDDPKKISD